VGAGSFGTRCALARRTPRRESAAGLVLKPVDAMGRQTAARHVLLKFLRRAQSARDTIIQELRMSGFFAALSAAAFSFAFVANVHAHEFTLGDLQIGHPWARATPPGAQAGGAFMKFTNKGKTTDKLVKAETPAAGAVELHTMSMDGNVMRMREVNAIEVQPGATVTLAPGGLHVMLVGLKQPLKQGDKVPMTLWFEKAGKVEVHLAIDAMGAAPPADVHKH
jgi:copper(I)-binding protein